MPATTTREESHARTKNMRGGTFIDWEELVNEHFQPVLAAVLEERAKNDLSTHIPADRMGRCPHCMSGKIYLRLASCQPAETAGGGGRWRAQKTKPFGKMVKIEAERRGFHTAGETIVMGDGGNWIVATCVVTSACASSSRTAAEALPSA